MKTIKIKSITAENFKKFTEKVTFVFGNVNHIFGMNGVGKTTIADALSWVLFNKLYDGSKPDVKDIRPTDKDGNVIHFVDIIVSVVLDVDGKEIAIEKVQKEKWTKHSGETEKVLTGNENKYTVNEVPKSEKAFRDYFDEIITEEVFRFSSNPGALMQLKPKDLRAKLFELVSDFSNDDVIASDSELEPLRELLAKYTVEELMARNKKALSEYNKRRDEIPSRIDENKKSLVEIDESAIELQKKALEEQIRAVEEEEQNASKQADTYNKIQSDIMQAKFELGDIEREENQSVVSQKQTIRKLMDSANEEKRDIEEQIRDIQRLIEDNKNEIIKCQEIRKECTDKFTELANQKMDENSLICPNCGQTLPEDKKEQIINEFETKKRKQLDELRHKGKNAKALEEDNVLANISYENTIKIKHDSLTIINEKLAKLQSELDGVQEADLTKCQRYVDKQKEIESLQDKLSKTDTGAEYRQQLRVKRLGLFEELKLTNNELAKASNNVRVQDRIVELETEHKELAQKIANVEREQNLIEKFNRKRVDMLSEAINEHFSIVKWRFFSPLVNGGFEEVCEPMINGISYNRTLNKGHKVVVELDIVRAMQKISEVNVPVIVDDAERVNMVNVPKMDCQLITMSVKDPYIIYAEDEEGNKIFDDNLQPIVLDSYDGSFRMEVE